MRPHPFLAGPHPRAVAHRGWHADELAGWENTLAAFTRAVEEGYAYLETDARATVDGVVVLLHDATLDRTTDSHGAVAALPLVQVRRARVAGREPVPTLVDALRAVPGARWNIDVKSDDTVLPVLAALEAADAWDRVCLASFSESRQQRLRRLAGPRLMTAAGPRAIAALRVRSVLPVGVPGGWSGGTSGAVVQVPVGPAVARLVDRRFLAQAHRHGQEVHVWTVDDPAEQERLLELGVDGIITDDPAGLRAVLDARGLWRPGPGR